ncbi:hemerythrin domain-containing protein [Nocardia pseudovaccinii]|uniref:hemerythrin domain-containing protein n=1 Tax=Nocardia pseudovaccinii TaxID=189540 RepID=UPI0007C7AA8C|nr:hemerythrin domain-containing protein [Nocardia pseudovaccinii]
MASTDLDANRARALGQELVAIHDWLRTELTRIRVNVTAYAAGSELRPTQLRAHCTAFCAALTRHHTGEDTAGFPALAGQFPELAPVLAELRTDHQLVADILRRLTELLDSIGPDNADTVRRELDGLAAILESHFHWEERRLVQAFDELDMGTSTGEELLGVTVAVDRMRSARD